MVLGIGLLTVWAELPPWAYKERQDKAPEALVIKVRSVKTHVTKEPKVTRTELTIEAQVEKVERSATKLVPGAVIKIYYERNEYAQPIAGPSEIPALKQGQVCPAYLEHLGNVYVPAAGGYSFETVR
jgi:hypothetical protein